MDCHFCQRFHAFLFGRRRCEACERAMRAVARHERSTQNLTRAALDQIEQSAVIFSETPDEYSDVAAAVEDALRAGAFGGSGED